MYVYMVYQHIGTCSVVSCREVVLILGLHMKYNHYFGVSCIGGSTVKHDPACQLDCCN